MVTGLVPVVRRVVTKVIPAKDNLYSGFKKDSRGSRSNIGSVIKLGSTRF